MTDRAETIRDVCAALDHLGIAYQYYHHPPVTSCAEAIEHVRGVPGQPNKSLLLHSRNGERLLVIVPCQLRLDLAQLADQLGCRRLSFASAAELQRLLGVTPGSVSPFGLLHDQQHEIQIIIHPDILRQPVCQFHPNDNRGTLVLATHDFLKFLAWTKHAPTILSFPHTD